MNDLHSKAVFFVKDAERSLRFYTEALGFSLDWMHRENERPFVFQVSLMGFQLLINQTEPATERRAGHGRVFIGLDAEQAGAFLRHMDEKHIEMTVVQWGSPTLVLRDLDHNEVFIWLPENERSALEADLESD